MMKFFFWRKRIHEHDVDTPFNEQRDPYLEEIVRLLIDSPNANKSKLENEETEKEIK